jgi:hypothetical protein
MSIPNEDALICQNWGIGEIILTTSDNLKITENFGDTTSNRQTEFLRVFEYQNENNLLTKDKGKISDYKRLLSKSYIITPEDNNDNDSD